MMVDVTQVQQESEENIGRDYPKRERVVSSCGFEVMAKAVIIRYTEKALKKKWSGENSISKRYFSLH